MEKTISIFASMMMAPGARIQVTLSIARQPPILFTREWRPRNFCLTTESTFKALHNPNNPIHHDVVINNSEDESVMEEDDSGRRPRRLGHSRANIL